MRLFGVLAVLAVSLVASLAAELSVFSGGLNGESIAPYGEEPGRLRLISYNQAAAMPPLNIPFRLRTEADASYATRLFCPKLLGGPHSQPVKEVPIGDSPTIMKRYRERVEKQLRSGVYQPIKSLEASPLERAIDGR